MCSSKSPDFEVVCILSLTGQVLKQLENCLFKTAKSGDFAERVVPTEWFIYLRRKSLKFLHQFFGIVRIYQTPNQM